MSNEKKSNVTEMNPTRKDAGTPEFVGPPAEGEPPVPPNCPGCGEPLPGVYLYLFQLQQPAPLPVMLFQAICCPRTKCLTAITVLPAGQIPNKIAAPGGGGWPT